METKKRIELKSKRDKQYIHKNILRLNPQQAQKKFDEVFELIEETNEIYNLEENLYKRKELDEKIAKTFIAYPDILTIQNEYGENLGMLTAYYKLEQAVLVALDNIDACLQQNHEGYNIGMFAATACLEQATLKALDNYEASLQQNKWEENIGMIAVRNGLKQAALKALDNKGACEQVNDSGESIESLYQEIFESVLVC